jgi:hypothetical protein
MLLRLARTARQTCATTFLGEPVPIHQSLRSLGIAAAAGVLVLGLGACSDEPERDETGAITEEGDADVFTLKVGDCLTDQAGATGEVSDVPVVPCEQPHDSEIYFAYIIPDAETFPGTFDEHINSQCVPQFETFVGVHPDSSALQLNWLEPTAQSWAEGDRELLCIVADPAGQVTGSLQGAAR